jgi:uncharacterized membrane protein YgcG
VAVVLLAMFPLLFTTVLQRSKSPRLGLCIQTKLGTTTRKNYVSDTAFVLVILVAVTGFVWVALVWGGGGIRGGGGGRERGEVDGGGIRGGGGGREEMGRQVAKLA